MFSKNGHDSCSFPDQSFFKQDFHLPISFFPFPSPFEVEDDMFLQPHHFITGSEKPSSAMEEKTNTANSNPKASRKRSSKKDRHSKITTARGLRDRRMRLSLAVAKEFFALQDMLGVDKGSKTVEWLLIQAAPEIIKLAKERNYSLDRAKSVSSSTSECDVVSGIDEVGVGDNHKQVEKLKNGKEKRIRQPRKTMAKELRDMARARARARTREKLQIRDSVQFDHDLTKITSSWSSPFETGEESACAQSFNVNPAIEVEKPITTQFETSKGMIDYQNSFEIIGKWSPSASTFNYLQQTETLLEEEHQFPDPQLFG